MKFREIFRFELAYQLRRPWPWLSFAILFTFAFANTRVGVVPVTLPQDFVLNSPFIIASVSVFSCLIWLLVSPPIAGEAAARDVHTGMHPLTYSSPVSKTEYLGGRFLAALALNALILVSVQLGSLLAVYLPGVAPEIIGPFRPAAYLSAYAFIALPNALIATTFQFVAALKSGRSMASYLGSGLLFFLSLPASVVVMFVLGRPALAKLIDPIGMMGIMNAMMSEWTVVEKNVRMFTLEGPVLWNRLLWFGISVATLVLTYARFRFAHRIVFDARSWISRRLATKKADADAMHARVLVTVPDPRRTFGVRTRLHQLRAIAWSSFKMIATSPAGLFLLVAYPAFLFLVLSTELQHWGVPLLPRTDVLTTKWLTAPLTYVGDFRMIVPLLLIFLASELIWRERDAGMSENVDATSVSEWVLFLGKYLGLGMILAALMSLLIVDGMLIQATKGYSDFQFAHYVRVLFGLQLPEYLLFAVLVFAVHAIVNQKHVGMLTALVALILMIFAPFLHIEHNLLVYAASPAWYYTDMRGFGSSLGPWIWFKLYWSAWALLLAAATRVFWVRGRETGVRGRVRLARQRLAGATIRVTAVAVFLIVTLGGFIFYNTNVINTYRTASELAERQAEYERRYGRYEGIAQPERSATRLRVEIYPQRKEATFSGSYILVNRTAEIIDSVHVEPAAGTETTITFDRETTRVLADGDLQHFIYKLGRPLAPGDSVTLRFDVRYKSRGFRNSGVSIAVVDNGSWFTDNALPRIGYRQGRELTSADERRKQGLPRQITFPPPEDVNADALSGTGSLFEAVVGTDEGQVAVAPGRLRRKWTEAGRSYFEYVSEVPITGQPIFFSADYVVQTERWNDVDVVFYTHPGDTSILPRMIRGARASLDYYATQFAPYPYPFLQFVEQPAKGFGMGVDGSGVVTGLEGFYDLNPQSQDLDAVLQIVAHEVAHQWWGVQLKYAPAEGAILLSESLAWYSGMQVVKRTLGREQLRRFMHYMREPNPWPQIRTGLPLLRAMDPYAGYRKGPFAFYALSEYIGEERVNGALRALLQKKGVGSGALATTVDLYRELQAVTPDSQKPLLHDLFAVNTFWTFDTKEATAVPLGDGRWQVTLEVDAHKVVADSAGKETVLPISELIEFGIFADAQPGEILGKPLYLQRHRVRTGLQTITMIVAQRPARGGIDPYNLLDWEEGDNIEPIEVPDK